MANVLVVDDSKVMRFHISKILEELGHTVVDEAKDGFEAIKKYKEHMPELVTMDEEMPPSHEIESGADAVKEILEFDSLAKIVMISSQTDKEHISKALKNGAKNYIKKPITSKKLANIITRLGLSYDDF